MVSIDLTASWITNMTTPSVSVTAQTERSRSEALEVAGSIKTYLGGRRRIVTTPSVTEAIGVTLLMLDDDDYDLIRSWAGDLLMYRDNQGRKVFGTYFSVEEAFHLGGLHDVKITFEASTHSEAV